MSDQARIKYQELLSKSLVFRELLPEQADRLVKFAKTKRVEARETVFCKADAGQQMFAIISGRVKMSTLSEDGKEMVFGILGPGEIFGEISLLDGKERTATITAIEPSELLVIERRDFIPFLEKYPEVAIRLLAVLALRLRMTDELFEDTLFRNLPSRLAKKLLTLAKHYGRETGSGTEIGLKLSQTEIGSLVGTSRESVNKQMRSWEHDGLIVCKKGYITIRRPRELEALSYLES